MPWCPSRRRSCWRVWAWCRSSPWAPPSQDAEFVVRRRGAFRTALLLLTLPLGVCSETPRVYALGANVHDGGRNKTIVADGARIAFVRTLQNLMVFSLTSPTLLVVCVEVRLLGCCAASWDFSLESSWQGPRTRERTLMISTRIDSSLVLVHGSAPLASPATSLATKCEAGLASFVQSAPSGRAPCSWIFSFRICSARERSSLRWDRSWQVRCAWR